MRWASHLRCHEKQITRSVRLSILIQFCKITFYYIDTCVLLKNIPYSWNLYETSSGYWVVYFSFLQSLHIDDVMYLFFTVFCAHSQLANKVKLSGGLNIWFFSSRLKNNILPLENTFLSLLRPVIPSPYLHLIMECLKSGFWFSWHFIEVLYFFSVTLVLPK